MALLPVADALARILDGVSVLGAEMVPLGEAAGRVLAQPIAARRTQPPFHASAMDGYAVRAADVAIVPAGLTVIGQAPAGKPFAGSVGPGEAVRIFTGAPMPAGTDAVLIQENTQTGSDGRVKALDAVAAGRNVRRKGLDFVDGEPLLEAGRVLDAAALSLAAAANHATLPVVRRPLLAVLATGDELVPPGTEPGPGQIVASNAYGVAAIAKAADASVLDLGIVADREDRISAAVEQARAAGADVVVTLGGASVGDHDLVRAVLLAKGLDLGFWKIAMRPGKPLMFGRLGSMRVLGLPGNPVASLVCSHLFLKPLLARLGGRTPMPDMRDAILGADMVENDQREDYVRARVTEMDGRLVATPFALQDSSMLRTLAEANALVIREPHAPAASAGAPCRVLMLR